MNSIFFPLFLIYHSLLSGPNVIIVWECMELYQERWPHIIDIVHNINKIWDNLDENLLLRVIYIDT